MSAGASLNVMISSAGRRVALLECFREALIRLKRQGQVLAADASPLSAAFHAADQGHCVPRCHNPEYVPALVRLCREKNVALVVPTIDPELPVLAEARGLLEEVGTTVAVSEPETVALAWDKVLLHKWLSYNGFPTVSQTTVVDALTAPKDWPLPLVLKPKHGSGSVGVVIVTHRAELEVAAEQDDDYLVVQSFARGAEYTVDVLVNRAGRCVCAVPRRRVEIRGGEVSKSVTVRNPALEALVHELVEALPGPYGPLSVQAFVDEAGAVSIIEVNARFGGGFPLSWRAGADYPRWMLEELLGLPSTASETWQEGLVMLRYDQAVFVDAASAGLG